MFAALWARHHAWQVRNSIAEYLFGAVRNLVYTARRRSTIIDRSAREAVTQHEIPAYGVSGRHLDWFWREFFLEAPRFGQAIDSVAQTVRGHETHVTVTYANKGRAVLPLFVRFTFSDGTTQDVRSPVDVWRANSVTYTTTYIFRNKTVRRIALDPAARLPDSNRTDNVWTAP